MNCSFCGKRPDEVFRIITSASCAICNECVGVACNQIADEYKTAAHEVQFLKPTDPKDAP